MSNNPNHPKKGSAIKVYPIRTLQEIKELKKMLRKRPRDLALFTLGINSALRASDLLRIKVSQVRHLMPGDYFDIVEKKTKKRRAVTLNGASYITIQSHLRKHALHDNAYLFSPYLNPDIALKVPTVHKMVKNWCKRIGLKENYGSHTLRKTFGYHQHKTFGTDLPTLVLAFNHSHQRQTLEYLCIQEEEVHECFMNEL